METSAIARESAEFSVAQQEIDLVAIDQLARLQHGGARVAAREILHHQVDAASKNAPLGVNLLKGELTADQFVLAQRAEGAGQRIVEANLHDVGGSHTRNERARELRRANRKARF